MADTAAPSTRRFGAQSMTAPLHEVLVKRPGEAFGNAHDDPAHGFLHPVDLTGAQRQHDAFCSILTGLGVAVHQLETETASPDLVYTFDPALVTDRGLIGLRSGKPTRQGESAALEAWAEGHDIPVVGRLGADETADGGDTFWLTPEVFCIGRSLRTNSAGARRLTELVGGDVHVFDVPYANGPAECLHLLSVISPVADDIAAVFLPQLPAGLYELLVERGVEMVSVPEDELATQGCNILAVRPGVVVMVEGNPVTQRALVDRGCEVHTFAGTEVCINGSGGPTCITRPLLRG
ncbi:MAG TPA: arginine deiminase family protein [Gaiellales bacterium]|jgi:N-dimethylarginine dimethylaminohydrolase